MKNFINIPEHSVNDSLHGLVAASGGAIRFHPQNERVVLRGDLPKLAEKVTLVGGGGSGHEPFAAGFVGKNALTAAVCGDIFASPPSSSVLDAICAVNNHAGTLVLVINYTGDRLNFGVAVEKVKSDSSHKIALVSIDDDVALEHKSENATGSRGLAGACLLIHIVGVLAEHHGLGFDELVEISLQIVENTATFGVTLSPCALPGHGKMFELGEAEYELGLGIHGESGVERKKMESAKEICAEVLQRLVKSKRLNLSKDDEIAVLLNNLGAVSQLEMGILKREIMAWMVANDVKVRCFIAGTLMTSLDAHGFSISVLRISDARWLQCILEHQSAVSCLWTATKIDVKTAGEAQSGKNLKLPELKDRIVQHCGPSCLSVEHSRSVKKCLESACSAIIGAEAELNRLDTVVGDGDCGTSMSTAAKAILGAIERRDLDFNTPRRLFMQLSAIFEQSIGGTSGAIYALMLSAAGKALEGPLSSGALKSALRLALECVEFYAGAKPGYRTLVDPLDAAANCPGEDWAQIVEAAEVAAKSTAQMEAKAGRASYTNTLRQLEPDPGAMAFAVWFRAAYNAFQGEIEKK